MGTKETTRHNTSAKETTRHNTSTTRDNKAQHEYTTSTIRQNTRKTRPNTSTQEGRAAKIGLCFALFVAKLYIFLIFFRNG